MYTQTPARQIGQTYRRSVGARTWLGCLFFALALINPAAALAAGPTPALPESLLPTYLKLLPGQSATQLPDGQWLLLGGRFGGQPVADAQLYDPVRQRTQALGATLREARAEHSATLLPDGTVAVYGGIGADGALVKTAERYTPATGQITALPSFGLAPRAFHRATVLADGRLLVTGGIDAQGTPVDTALLIDPTVAETQTAQSPQPIQAATARAGHQAALLPRHDILLWGGRGTAGQLLADAERFDPVSQQFHNVAPAAAADALAFLGDRAPPQLIDSAPADGSTDVAAGQRLSLRFSKPLNVKTLNPRSVTLIGPEGSVDIDLTPAEFGLVLFVKPKQPLRPASDYALMLHKAQDYLAQPLEFTAIGFRTAALAAGASSAAPPAATPTAVPASETGTIRWRIVPAAASATTSASTSAASATATPAATAATPAVAKATAAAEQGASAEAWAPGPEHYRGNWRSGRVFPHSRDALRSESERQAFLDALTPRARAAIESRWREQGRLPDAATLERAQQAKASQRARGDASLGYVTGQVLRLNGLPLAGATLSMAGKTVRSDAAGEFRLDGIPPGAQVLAIDGASANRPGAVYGRHDYRMDVQAGANVLDFTIWMSPLDTAHTLKIPSPTVEEVVLTHPQLPGLELHIPPGTVIRDAAGQLVTEIGMTPIPVDQTPFPMPYLDVPIFFTLQPGGATLHTVAGAPAGVRIDYPNYSRQPAGARVQLFDYDPRERGWFTYTEGSVSRDGQRIDADQPFTVYQFTTLSSASSGYTPAPGDGPPPEGCCAADAGCAGDPVACASGLFLEEHTDLALPDIVPLALRRSYRQNDSNLRAFGIGAAHDLDQYLYFINQSSFTADAIDLVMGNGARVRFAAPPDNRYYNNARFRSSEPGRFHKATVERAGSELIVTLRDGSRLGFSYYVSRLKWIEDRQHNRTTLYRDGSGRVASAVTPNGRWLELEYAAPTCLNCISKITDNAGRSVAYQYDAAGHLTRVTDAEGGLTEYTYDSSHRMITVKDARGNTKVTNTYDANGRVQQQTYADASTTGFAYTLDGNGKVTRTDITHARGDIRRMTFDSAGRLLTDTRALGRPEQQTRSYTRNADGLVTDLTDPLGRIIHTTYDTRGNPLSVTRLYGTADALTWRTAWHPVLNQPVSHTDPLGHGTSYTYDANGRLTRSADPLGNRSDLAWTPEGRLASLTRYDGATALSTTFTYEGPDLVGLTDPLGRSTTFLNDAAGRGIAVTDPLGRTTRSTWDRLGRPTSVTDAQGNITRNTWDGNGNLTAFTDAKGNATAWTYDARNRPLTKTDALGRTEREQYDAAGNLIFHTDRQGQVTGFEYDLLNRRTRIGYGATSSTAPAYQSTLDYTLDAGNRVTRLVDSANGTLSWTYDNRFDTITRETSPEGSIASTWRANGQRQSMTPGGGPAITYTYDAADRLTGISQAAGSGPAAPATIQNLGFTWDSADRKSSLTLPNGIRAAYAWDTAGQLIGLTYRKADGSLIGDLTYTYDAAGQRAAIGGSLAATDLPNTVAGSSVDANNRLTSWNGTPLIWDDNGNLTSDGTNVYTWNSRNQLSAVSGPVNASFQYDALGRRRGKTIAGVTTKYLYDGANPIQELNGTTVTANLLAGPAFDEWYGRTSGGTTITYLSDALGSTLQLTDATQTSVASYRYEPYGKTTVSGSPGSNSLAYTGREEDGTGLYYYRARYYHPGVGRFVAEDPIGLDGGSNLYGYVDGNPLGFVDPLGLAKANPFDPIGGVGGGGGGSVGGGLRPAPNFVVSPNGTTFPVPPGAVGPRPVINPSGAQTGVGFTGGAGGANGQVSTMRLMCPTPPRGSSPGYPNGYIKYQNSQGQGVNPYTGQTLPNSQSHFPVD